MLVPERSKRIAECDMGYDSLGSQERRREAIEGSFEKRLAV
jgi:hypothetical protein